MIFLIFLSYTLYFVKKRVSCTVVIGKQIFNKILSNHFSSLFFSYFSLILIFVLFCSNIYYYSLIKLNLH